MFKPRQKPEVIEKKKPIRRKCFNEIIKQFPKKRFHILRYLRFQARIGEGL